MSYRIKNGKVIKKQRGKVGDIVYIGPLFWNILDSHGGIFPNSSMDEIVRSFAAWYVARNCHIALKTVPGQVTLEGDTDVTVNLRNVAKGAALGYGIEDLNEIMNLMPLCRRWAFMQGKAWDSRFQAWLDSGGYSYNEVTREPDAI